MAGMVVLSQNFLHRFTESPPTPPRSYPFEPNLSDSEKPDSPRYAPATRQSPTSCPSVEADDYSGEIWVTPPSNSSTVTCKVCGIPTASVSQDMKKATSHFPPATTSELGTLAKSNKEAGSASCGVVNGGISLVQWIDFDPRHGSRQLQPKRQRQMEAMLVYFFCISCFCMASICLSRSVYSPAMVNFKSGWFWLRVLAASSQTRIGWREPGFAA